MSRLIGALGRRYESYARGLSYLQHPFLLLVRLYWGGQFFVAGRGKLMHLDQTAAFFAGLGIPAPRFNALMAGSTECVGGLLLLAGAASRVITAPLIVTMIVAYWTAHREQVSALFSNPDDFTSAPPFLFLAACVIVLLFGPGAISVDRVLGLFLGRRKARDKADATGRSSAEWSSAPFPVSTEGRSNRRLFAYLTLAAFGGLLAGTRIRRDRKDGGRGTKPGPEPGHQGSQGSNKDGEGSERASVSSSLAKGADASGSASESHICRGLNDCKGRGKDGRNSCAGRGTCATIQSHACNGLNDCKGHGGCGNEPGLNQCKGQGACAVPLKDKTWVKARRHFEQLSAKKGKAIGPAPAKG